jgi:hypothetical protein
MVENGHPLQHAHVFGPVEDELKEKDSDTSSHGGHEANHTEDVNPVTGKLPMDLLDDKIEITEEDCMDELGFSYPEWKKWIILTARAG